MALTDLTNTTWILNDTLSSYPGGTYTTKTYNINITTETPLPYSGDTEDTFVAIMIGYDSGGEHNRILVLTSLPQSYYNFSQLAYGHDTKSLPDTWNTYYDKSFTITGGTDATNSTLISWLEQNATTYTPPVPDVVVSYNDNDIVTMTDSDIKTLATSGTYCTDDIKITFTKQSGGGSTTYSTFTTATDGLVPHPSVASTVSLLNSSGTWTELPIKSDGGSVSGNITLAGPAASNSPSLIFQRGTFTDNYNDWQIQDRGGFLYFDQRGSGSSNFSNQVVFNTSGNVSAVSFSGSGASLTNLNASNLSSGTVSSARLPLATTAAVGAVKPDGTTITVDSNGVISASGGSTPLIGTTATVTPTQVKTALREGTDICIEYHGTFDQIPLDFRFTSWNGATDEVTGQALDAVVSQTIVYYNSNYYLFNLTGVVNNGQVTNYWTLNQTPLDTGGGGSTGFTYIAENTSYGSVLLGNTTDNAATGTNSIAEGGLTSASGDYAHA